MASLKALAASVCLAGATLLPSFSARAESSCVHLRGYVNDAMLREVKEAIGAGRRSFCITSHGGLVVVGLAIGSVLRSNAASVIAVSVCESACAVAVMGADHRFAAWPLRFGFHRVSYSYDQKLADGWTLGLVEFLKQRGCPAHFAEERGHAVNVKALTDAELRACGVTVIPSN